MARYGPSHRVVQKILKANPSPERLQASLDLAHSAALDKRWKAEDHALARVLAESLDALPGLSCPPGDVETNLVPVRVDRPEHDAASLAAALAERGVRVLPLAADTLRFVTHLDVGPADVERLSEALESILGAA